MRSCEEKVPGGKLVNVSIGRDGVRVSGDFFISPEEGVFQIEEMLCGLNGDETVDVIAATLSRLVREKGVTLTGLDEHTIARLYRGAVNVASHRP